ncbi:MAG: TRAM domain-containing protein, partial [Sedimenticolaceae bacterium]
MPEGEFEVEISSMGHDGRGVALVEGKATFVHGALPGEKVNFRYLNRRRSHDEGQVVSVIRPSEDRVEPRCDHDGVCGGCSLQHLE